MTRYTGNLARMTIKPPGHDPVPVMPLPPEALKLLDVLPRHIGAARVAINQALQDMPSEHPFCDDVTAISTCLGIIEAHLDMFQPRPPEPGATA